MSVENYRTPQPYERTTADSAVATVRMLLIDEAAWAAEDDITRLARWLWMQTADGADTRDPDLAADFDPDDEVTPQELIHALVAEIARCVRPMADNVE